MEITAPSHCRVQRKGMAENQEHFIYGNKGQQIRPQAEICLPQNTRASLNSPYQTALALRPMAVWYLLGPIHSFHVSPSPSWKPWEVCVGEGSLTQTRKKRPTEAPCLPLEGLRGKGCVSSFRVLLIEGLALLVPVCAWDVNQ